MVLAVMSTSYLDSFSITDTHKINLALPAVSLLITNIVNYTIFL